MSVRGEMGVLREKTNTQGILEATAQTLSLLGKSCNHLELIRLSQAGRGFAQAVESGTVKGVSSTPFAFSTCR